MASLGAPRWLPRNCQAASVKASRLSRSCFAACSTRRSYSTSHQLETCELAFDAYDPPAGVKAADQSLVICHGLLGSKQNWRSLSRAFGQRLGMPVYTVDLRNHGHSPHKEPHTYSHMAADIARFFEDRGLRRGVNLLGHSMGGKAVMAVALNDKLNAPLRTLISVDMTPARGKLSSEFAQYTVGMQEVEDARVKSKQEGDKILQPYEPELSARQFLLTNAITKPDGTIGFRVPLGILSSAIPAIGDFPYAPPVESDASKSDVAQWSGPTLFVKGKHSAYINRKNIPIAQAMFPKMRLEQLDTGHWVHSERPKEFVDLVAGFIEGAEAN